MSGHFDEIIDVAIVGYGFAGGMTAIASAKAGRQAIIFEKMSIPGGISICSGGGFRVAIDKDKAFEYLKATNAQTIDERLLEQFSEEMVKKLIQMTSVHLLLKMKLFQYQPNMKCYC
jgi:succinate dehydrogenase/fumarate reductase flavoprotein subunit